MTYFRLLGTVTLLFWLLPGAARAQPLPTAAQEAPAPEARPQTNDDETMRKLQIEREKKRFAAIRQDAAKRLDVATELKQHVDKTGKDVLSLEVLRKAEEMEKLARQIKNNLRGE
jgi:hypothetical protein